MKLKPGGKIAIFLLIGVIAYFVVRRYIPMNKTADTTTSTLDSSTVGTNKQAQKSTEPTTKTDNRSFNFTPEKPVDGALRGVVEVGATGFNSFVINMDKQRRWEIVSKDFGESLAYEGLATTEDIRTGLKKYLAMMFEKGVNKKDMHFVISSGAQKEPKTKVIGDELKKIGYVVNLVTPSQEAKYGFRASVPPPYQDNSFLVDVGSGNTKISWQEGENIKALETAGSKYYEHGQSDNAVADQVKSAAGKIPEGKRNVCFIIGGVPFTLAKQTREGEERYTVLHPPDTYKAANDKKMAAGLVIYKAIGDATNCDTFVFDWDANFTIGFLLGLPMN